MSLPPKPVILHGPFFFRLRSTGAIQTDAALWEPTKIVTRAYLPFHM